MTWNRDELRAAAIRMAAKGWDDPEWSVPERIMLAFAATELWRLPEPYGNSRVAWERLNREQRSTVLQAQPKVVEILRALRIGTVAERLQGLFTPVSRESAAMAERVAVMAENLRKMRELLPHVPAIYPHPNADEGEIRDWLRRIDGGRKRHPEFGAALLGEVKDSSGWTAHRDFAVCRGFSAVWDDEPFQGWPGSVVLWAWDGDEMSVWERHGVESEAAARAVVMRWRVQIAAGQGNVPSNDPSIPTGPGVL